MEEGGIVEGIAHSRKAKPATVLLLLNYDRVHHGWAYPTIALGRNSEATTSPAGHAKSSEQPLRLLD